METLQELYSKKDKDFFYGQIQGTEELGGLRSPVPNYSLKIKGILDKRGAEYTKTYIRGVLWNKTVNDEIWDATVEMLLSEGKKRKEMAQRKAALLQN